MSAHRLVFAILLRVFLVVRLLARDRMFLAEPGAEVYQFTALAAEGAIQKIIGPFDKFAAGRACSGPATGAHQEGINNRSGKKWFPRWLAMVVGKHRAR